MPLLDELFSSVTSRENATFWWVGDEDNWDNVFCAFEHGKMVAKGQVSIINIVPARRSAESKHSIYMNLKTIPERESNYELLEQVYQHLFTRALHLQESLSNEYRTILCVGNDSTEMTNSQFFIKQKGFQHRESLFKMECNLNDIMPEMSLDEAFHVTHWIMETSEEENEYLKLNAEVWPETPLGQERLAEYKQNPLWTAMVVREGQTITASLMVWQEEKSGCIEVEDVFVRIPWRKRGIAKNMLSQALLYLKSNGLEQAYLMVLTTNTSALSLYESVGFYKGSEERRYCIELN